MFNIVPEAVKMIHEAEKKIKSTSDNIKEEISDIEEKLSIIGYKITTIEVSITIPPRFSFEIDAVHSIIDKELKDNILKESKPILKAIIIGLDKAFDMEKTISFNHKILSTIIVETSLIPTIKLIYKEF
jgi:hypothetical protein